MLLGASNPPLSESGKARAAATVLPPVASLYTSHMRRSLETAAAISKGTPRIVLAALNEISYGDWDGRTWAEIERLNRRLAAAKLRDWRGVTPPRGELWSAFEARVLDALEYVLWRSFPAAIVGHSAVNSIIDAKLTGSDPLRFRQDHCEIREYDI